MVRPSARIASSFIGAALTLAVGGAGWMAVRTLDGATERVEHTVLVLDGFQNLFEYVLDSESSQRGYLLTGEERYLAPYRRGIARARTAYSDLRRLTSDNASQQARLDTISTALDAKRAELDSTIALRFRGDVTGAIGLVRSDEGLRATMTIRRMLAAAQGDEQGLLARRADARDRARLMVILIIVPGALAACLLTFAAMRREQRDLDYQRATNEQLEEQSMQLQDQAGELEVQASELEGQVNDSRALAAELDRTNVNLATALEDSERSRRAAEVAENHLSRLIEQAPVAIAITRGPNFVVEAANPRFHDVVGKRELVSRPMRDAVPEIVEQGLLDALQSTYHSGTAIVKDELAVDFARGENGTPRGGVFDFVYQPLRDEQEVVYGVAIVATEVTEKVQERRAIDLLRVAADEASRAKSEFIASMSHELRTPLNAIIGYESLLRQGFVGDTTPQQNAFLERIRTSADHLLGLIEDVLSLSRIEAGQVDVRWSIVDAHEALKDAAGMVEPAATAKRLDLVVEPVEEPIILVTDRQRLGQCLINLTNNAVKYTDVGQVRLRARLDEDDVVFDIADSGIGISSDHITKIFDAFWQVEQSTTRRVGGAGLGLNVTRRLAGLLGGRVAAQSTAGVGSTFSLRLPRKRTET